MTKSVQVKIGGREYTLRGEDEEKLLFCARKVDAQLQKIQSGGGEHAPTTMMAIMAALNLEGQHYDKESIHEEEVGYITSELQKMTDYLKECFVV